MFRQANNLPLKICMGKLFVTNFLLVHLRLESLFVRLNTLILLLNKKNVFDNTFVKEYY